MRSDNKKWREFELMVTRIEHLLSPRGAVVKSPDRLPDKITGQLREVDATIRYRIGSVPIIITIECRDRTSVQDDIWIEQLVKKREKLAVSATIAVSSTGFSQPAKKSAETFGIELRTLKEISDDELSKLTEDVSLELEFREWKFLDIKVTLETAKPTIQLADDFLEVVRTREYSAPAAFRESDGQPITFGEIGEKFVIEGTYPLIPGIRPFGTCYFTQDPYVIPTTNGNIRVNRFDILVEVNFIKKPCSLKKVFEYGELKKPLVKIAEYEMPDNGQKIHIATLSKTNEHG
jgi:hypothetical protein